MNALIFIGTMHLQTHLLVIILLCLTSQSTFSDAFAVGTSAGVAACDIKRCSNKFRQATLSHNLSYDLSNEKIEEMCIKLNDAVDCFATYRKSCYEDNYQQSRVAASFFDQMSEGPLGLTMELCRNRKFRHDYLTLGPCQKNYRSEFDRCVRLNNQATSGGTDANSTVLERFIEHCCALHNYHNCIYDISEDKCGKDAAEFSLKILELFNRGYLRDCAKFANLSYLCTRNQHQHSSASALAHTTNSHSILLLSTTVLMLLFSSCSYVLISPMLALAAHTMSSLH